VPYQEIETSARQISIFPLVCLKPVTRFSWLVNHFMHERGLSALIFVQIRCRGLLRVPFQGVSADPVIEIREIR
jgi:hypothetical protein